MREPLHFALTRCRHSSWQAKARRNNQPQLTEWAGEDSFAGDYRPGRPQRVRWNRLVRTPLLRWLRAQVGRPWNAIWSELSEGFGRQLAHGVELREIAACRVDLHCRIDTALRRPLLVDGRPVTGLYVDPRSGLLRWMPPLSKAQRRRPPHLVSATTPDTLWLGDNRFRIKRNGIWFDADATPQCPFTDRKSRFDFEWIGQRFTIVHKRSLNARALREAGLKNDDA